MNKKVLAVLVLIVLLTQPAIAELKGVTLTATGYEWLGYSQEEKNALVALAYLKLDIDKNKHKAPDIIKTLNAFYYGAIEKAKADPLHVDEDKFLRISCISVISDSFR